MFSPRLSTLVGPPNKNIRDPSGRRNCIGEKGKEEKLENMTLDALSAKFRWQSNTTGLMPITTIGLVPGNTTGLVPITTIGLAKPKRSSQYTETYVFFSFAFLFCNKSAVLKRALFCNQS